MADSYSLCAFTKINHKQLTGNKLTVLNMVCSLRSVGLCNSHSAVASNYVVLGSTSKRLRIGQKNLSFKVIYLSIIATFLCD